MSEKVSKSFFTHTINKKHKNISHNDNHLCAMRVKVRLDKGLFCSVLHTMYLYSIFMDLILISRILEANIIQHNKHFSRVTRVLEFLRVSILFRVSQQNYLKSLGCAGSDLATHHCTEHFALRHKLKSCTVTFCTVPTQ